MHEPELYHKAHKEAKLAAGQIIREHFSKVQWRPDGCDTLMDVGTGSGDVLMEYIYPLMPQRFHKIVCSDVSEKMIEFIRRHYGNREKFEYRVLNIESKTGVPNDLWGTVDHLTSTYVLNLVRDFEVSVKNVFDLLRSDGADCLLVFMTQNSVIDAYEFMRNSTKWLDYKEDIERFIPPIYYSKDPKDEFRSLLEKVGFTDVTVDTKPQLWNYDNLQTLRDNIKSVCCVLESIPTATLQSEFLDDLVAAVIKLGPMSKNVANMGTTYCIYSSLIVASAKKVSQANVTDRLKLDKAN